MKKEKLAKLKIPDKPGVYLFRKGRKILYIGKATSLRSRVRSYFGRDLATTRGTLVSEMVLKADNLKWQETTSVLEALVLEANLIKKNQPHHNLAAKDDKSFNYVVITKEKLPRVLIVRGKSLTETERQKAFGPYVYGLQLWAALKIIRKIFPYLDASASKRQNYEFYRQVGLAPDLTTIEGQEAYKKNIQNIKLFFQGKKKKILEGLKRDMKKYAQNQEFEKADIVKRQIFALRHINDVALIKLEPSAYSLGPIFRIEAYDVAHLSGESMVGVMTVVENGMAAKNEYRKFKVRTKDRPDDTGALAEVLDRRLAHPEWPYPNLIVVDGGRAQMRALQRVLQKSGVTTPILGVVKDEFHRPKNILGETRLARRYEREILLVSSEAHRFAISYHKNLRNKSFIR